MLKPRLYLDQPMGEGQSVALHADQARYLFAVMRLGEGDVFAAFNGRDGVWRARITQSARKHGAALLEAQIAPQRSPPDLWLLFAPIKKARTDFIVEKAAELGVARLLPVLTAFTQSARVNQERLQAHAVEAVEQCGGSFVPEVAAAMPLSTVLDNWESDRPLWFCDEALADQGPSTWPQGAAKGAVLIGPEGGFDARERGRLHAMEATHSIQLGPRVLRADTAAVAALTLWQVHNGDWQDAKRGERWG